ncbi:MAG: hypothetical protein GQ562_10650 [Anaerolineales bacterium]|nr:hypothetical protein [Anaerolineales bacterium]
MTEEIIKTPYSDEEVSDDDKLWAMLSWIPYIGIVLAIIALLMEPQKERAFVRFHAVQAIAATVIIGIVSLILSITVVLICIVPLLWLVTIYPAIQAYQGEWLELPWLTGFCKSQGWI